MEIVRRHARETTVEDQKDSGDSEEEEDSSDSEEEEFILQRDAPTDPVQSQRAEQGRPSGSSQQAVRAPTNLEQSRNYMYSLPQVPAQYQSQSQIFEDIPIAKPGAAAGGFSNMAHAARLY